MPWAMMLSQTSLTAWLRPFGVCIRDSGRSKHFRKSFRLVHSGGTVRRREREASSSDGKAIDCTEARVRAIEGDTAPSRCRWRSMYLSMEVFYTMESAKTTLKKNLVRHIIKAITLLGGNT